MRFGPEYGHCPDCGAYVGAEEGQTTPQHQPAGSREMCSGSGKPANA